MNKDKYIAEKLGLCWHDVDSNRKFFPICNICGIVGNDAFNPDFSAPAGTVMLLELMMRREDWDKFFDNIKGSFCNPIHNRREDMIPLRYILIPGAIRDAVYSWLKGRE